MYRYKAVGTGSMQCQSKCFRSRQSSKRCVDHSLSLDMRIITKQTYTVEAFMTQIIPQPRNRDECGCEISGESPERGNDC